MDEQFEKAEIFDTPEQLAASMQADTQTTTTEQAPQQESQPVEETSTPEVAQDTTPESEPQVETEQSQPQQKSVVSDESPQYSDNEIEEAVFGFLSEKLGRKVSSLDEFNTAPQEAPQLDERVEAIAKFVQETGRNPQDWFTYQSLNPSEMDDLTAVKVQMATENPSLSADEVELLLNSKYNLDADLASEQEVNVAKLQLKMEAQKARNSIENLRSQYQAPESQSKANNSFVNDQWLSDMSKEVDALEGLEFDLGNDKSFTFGLDENYKNQLKENNSQIESFFDSFVNEDGSWDFDALSSTMAVRDNVDKIVSSAYTQGLSDGQRGIVDKAANISTKSPELGQQPQGSALADQVKQIMRSNNSKMTFNI
tara:strand:+ start:2321 stop:3427 length:1107 start_codon:yes stop_codon:yes gene_type:complete